MKTLIRDRLWQERLAAYIARRSLEPFAWGSMDCGQFAAGAIEAMTGTNPVKGLLGNYRTEQGAARVVARMGGLEALVTGVLGEPRPALMAGIGDIGLSGAGELLVCNGDTWLGAGEGGVVVVELSGAVKSWRIG